MKNTLYINNLWIAKNLMKARGILFAGLAALFLVAGCYKMVIHENKNNLTKLEKGMTKAEVLKIMGKPNFHERYETLYGNQMLILFYYTQPKRLNGTMTIDECTPVVIKNDKLAGWGDDFYKWIQRREKKIEHQ